MRLKFITETLAYSYAGLRDEAKALGDSDGDGWWLADAATIELAFGDDPERSYRFHRFIEAQYRGILLVRGGKWISYGWCSYPRGSGPPHLPRWTSTLGACWIFGCHTHERFRNQGIYKQLLAHLIRLAQQRDPSAPIYIDTHAENIPSRRAILSAGFSPCGVISTFRVWAPVMRTRIVGGLWRSQESHPTLACGMDWVPAATVAGEGS